MHKTCNIIETIDYRIHPKFQGALVIYVVIDSLAPLASNLLSSDASQQNRKSLHRAIYIVNKHSSRWHFEVCLMAVCHF